MDDAINGKLYESSGLDILLYCSLPWTRTHGVLWAAQHVPSQQCPPPVCRPSPLVQLSHAWPVKLGSAFRQVRPAAHGLPAHIPRHSIASPSPPPPKRTVLSLCSEAASTPEPEGPTTVTAATTGVLRADGRRDYRPQRRGEIHGGSFGRSRLPAGRLACILTTIPEGQRGSPSLVPVVSMVPQAATASVIPSASGALGRNVIVPDGSPCAGSPLPPAGRGYARQRGASRRAERPTPPSLSRHRIHTRQHGELGSCPPLPARPPCIFRGRVEKPPSCTPNPPMHEAVQGPGNVRPAETRLVGGSVGVRVEGRPGLEHRQSSGTLDHEALVL